jgi:hypothetical protein
MKSFGWTQTGVSEPGFVNAFRIEELGVVRVTVRTAGAMGMAAVDIPFKDFAGICDGFQEVINK